MKNGKEGWGPHRGKGVGFWDRTLIRRSLTCESPVHAGPGSGLCQWGRGSQAGADAATPTWAQPESPEHRRRHPEWGVRGGLRAEGGLRLALPSHRFPGPGPCFQVGCFLEASSVQQGQQKFKVLLRDHFPHSLRVQLPQFPPAGLIP